MPDEPNGLVLWETIRLPSTCQTITDIDEASGELLVNVWGEPPAPPPPSNVLNGKVVAGRVAYQAANNRCILVDVEIDPL